MQYIYIYIYIYIGTESSFVVFETQTNEVSGWCGLSMLLNFSESEASVGETNVLGDISFLILSLVETWNIFFFNPKKMYFL